MVCSAPLTTVTGADEGRMTHFELSEARMVPGGIFQWASGQLFGPRLLNFTAAQGRPERSQSRRLAEVRRSNAACFVTLPEGHRSSHDLGDVENTSLFKQQLHGSQGIKDARANRSAGYA